MDHLLIGHTNRPHKVFLGCQRINNKFQRSGFYSAPLPWLTVKWKGSVIVVVARLNWGFPGPAPIV